MAAVLSISSFLLPASASAQTQSGPITISGKSGTTLEGLHITSSSGTCLTIVNSTGITIRNSEIGPCGGNGIVVSGGSGIRITDNYIHPEFTGAGCCDSGDGIYENGTTDLLIQGNVVAYGESNLEILHANTVNIIGNFLVNPRNFGDARGSNIQVWENSHSIVIENNYALASQDKSLFALLPNQSDSMSFGGGVDDVVVRNNYISGGFWSYGCALITEAVSNNIQFLNNTLVDTGQCGIGIEGGTNQVVSGNRILNRTPVTGGANTAIIVFKLHASDPACGPISITNNTAYQVKPGGELASYWNGGGCSPVNLSDNIWDQAAYSALTPAAEKVSAPKIPPQPSSCVANSSFSNQTALAGCNGSSVQSFDPGSSSETPTSVAPASDAPISDGFNSGALDTGLWSFRNPAGGSYSFTGTDLILDAPAGSNHDVAFQGQNNAVRILQPVGSADFTAEAKFDSIPNSRYQFEGILVEQDASNYLRFQIGSTGTALIVNCSVVSGGVETEHGSSTISASSGSLWLRIKKSGANWTETWSQDGVTYKTVGSFTQTLKAAGVGPFSGNFYNPSSAAPEFAAHIDYFSNTANPAK